MTREEIQLKLTEFLVELFEVSPGDISPNALLSEDLDLEH